MTDIEARQTDLKQQDENSKMLGALIAQAESKLIAKQEQVLQVAEHVSARRVPGGWLYFTQIANRSTSQTDTFITFVPFGVMEIQETRSHITEMESDRREIQDIIVKVEDEIVELANVKEEAQIIQAKVDAAKAATEGDKENE